MTKLEKLNYMKNRRSLLVNREKDNSKIVLKLDRKIRKLEQCI